MYSTTTDLHLTIEIGSDPIRGCVGRDDTEMSSFTGWIELAAAIESARQALGRPGREQRLGSVPGVKRAER